MKPLHRLLSGLSVLVLAVGALAGCGSDPTADASLDASDVTGTISLWHQYSDREAEVIQGVVDDFEKQYPKVHVEVHSQQPEDKVIQVMATGGNIDVMMSNLTSSLSTICLGSMDLSSYMKRDGISIDDFQPVFKDVTVEDGKQCSLPLTSDLYGLYVNQDMMQAAGYDHPPRTLGELEDMALKMTTYNDDGSIKTLGFNPLIGFYENTSDTFSAYGDVTWQDADGRAKLDDGSWTDIMTWQKELVDEIGYDKLKTFTSTLGDEWSADNAFESGKVAMMLDGEWRVAFIDDEAPDLNYSTAPFPVVDRASDQYGGGAVGAVNVAVNGKTQNPEAAWLLEKYLTTDPGATLTLANELKNIPTHKATAEDPGLEITPQYETFVDAAKSPYAKLSPVTTIGGGFTSTVDAYWDKYQQGTETDIDSGLQEVQSDINDQLELDDPK